jgi:hypothetical protein
MRGQERTRKCAMEERALSASGQKGGWPGLAALFQIETFTFFWQCAGYRVSGSFPKLRIGEGPIRTSSGFEKHLSHLRSLDGGGPAILSITKRKLQPKATRPTRPATGKTFAQGKSRRSFKTSRGLPNSYLDLSCQRGFVRSSSRGASELSGMPLRTRRLTTPGSAVML